MSKQSTVRHSAETWRQLEQLTAVRGETRSAVEATAVDRLWRDTHQSLHWRLIAGEIDACPWCGATRPQIEALAQ